MKLVSRTWVAVLALTCLTIGATPCFAGDSPASKKDAKVPVIRVVIDHEKHLALIPEGTVLPAGLQITSSVGMSDEALDVAARTPESERPLVFAYAPAERFVGIEPVSSVTSENRETVDFIDSVVLERKTVGAGNPCPVVIVVEVGPDITHELACEYGHNPYGNPTEDFSGLLTYPTTARRVRYYSVFDFPPPNPDQTFTARCSIPAGQCNSVGGIFYLPFPPGTTVISNARVTLPGACTQDPPYCPEFFDQISLPVVNP